MKILLVEDEPKLNSFVKKGLQQNSYVVDTAFNGSEALEMMSVNQYDLVLLDVMLPGQNGYEVLKNMREFNINLPVIMISALADTENVVKGLDMGATDYLRKPFIFDELLARIRVATRSADDGRNYTKLSLRDLTVDLLARKVYRNDVEIYVTNREFNLLKFLLLNTNRVVSKTEIAERVWEINFDMGSNVIEVHMSQLRRKIEEGFDTKIISTKIGMGYTIEGELIKA